MRKPKINFIIAFLAIISIISSCNMEPPLSRKVKFMALMKNHTAAEKVYLSGDNEKLGKWKPGAIELEKESDSIWSKTIEFKNGDRINFKFNAGSWWTEALDSNQQSYNNSALKVKSDTTVSLKIFDWKNKMLNGMPVLTSKRFDAARPSMVLDDLWKYKPGDSTGWSKEIVDDRDWKTVNPLIDWGNDPGYKWDGTGWFRFHMYVDSSLWGRSLAMLIGQLGASDIYYNGKYLCSYGEVGSSEAAYNPSQNRLWRELKLDSKSEQVIAVRYRNDEWKGELKLGFAPGFVINVKNVNPVLKSVYERTRYLVTREMVFTLIPLILFLFHLLLFTFYPKQRQNLFYAVCLLGFAGITYFNYEKYVVTNPVLIILYYRLNDISLPLTAFFGLLTSYSISSAKLPKRWMIFFVLTVPLLIFGIIDPLGQVTNANYVFLGLVMINLSIVSFRRKHWADQKGSRIMLGGFIVLLFFIAYQILIDYSIVSPPFNDSQVFVYGMLALVISMSTFLAYNFSQINRNLETQLENVKRLSEEAITQEKIAAKLEIERRTIEAENERKSRELESARKLQLSLLPSEIPNYKNLDIACYMRTATEVGGDYYDFFLSDNNGLTAVIGDATGHGLKAGNMVITIKGLLCALSENSNLEEIMDQLNNAIKKMNLNMLTMGLALVRLNGDRLIYSSAGMPQLFLLRNNEKRVEQIVLKTMPLGAFHNFPYNQVEEQVYPGDVILMVSDGLTELFNAEKEMFGPDRVGDLLLASMGMSSNETINYMVYESGKWAGDAPLADDMSAVVIKIPVN